VSWPRALREKVREFVTAATGGPWPQMRQQAQRLLDDLPPELPPGAAARPPPGVRAVGGGVDKSALPFAPNLGPSQRDRKVDRNGRVNVYRRRVMARSRGRCEFCLLGEALEAHHVLGGADRQALESEFTMAAVCGGPEDPQGCHHRCNASPAWAREQGLAFARRMAASAQARGDAAAAAGFQSTVELLEARTALAAAQERKPCQS
jgi:hypothetical protein